MRFKEIYLDNGATTAIDAEVLKKMLPYFNKYYGNASSKHSFGQEAKEALIKARKIIAASINAKPTEIIFTSGGTEANNLALKGLAFANRKKGNHIVTTKIEHKSILNSCSWLEKEGFKVTYLNVDAAGFVDPEELKTAITDETILVSIIHGHNEIGTIQNLASLGQICKEKNVYFHTDACQSYTKTFLDVQKQNLDLVSLNAHKLHGPKGVGALYIKEQIQIVPWQHGGNQENGFRSGTENIHGIVGFSLAVKIATDQKLISQMQKLRDQLIAGIEEIPEVYLNGPRGEQRLCNNINFIFSGVDHELLGNYLNQKLISSSAGSACSAKSNEPSYVLKSIGLSDQEANSSIRFTLSKFNTLEEIDYTIKTLKKLVIKLRR